MILTLTAFVSALLFVPVHARAQRPLPVIDMHLHALAADDNGPPPLALCVPLLSQLPPFDPRLPWGEVFMAALKNPQCPNPIWSPTTDEALMEQTIAVVERRNVIGILSGTPERVLRWSAAAPQRFIPSVQFQIGRDEISPDSMRLLFEDGRFAALGEISNQYAGIAPNDERMAPYWALAEELDIPVGIHMGEGPPGGAHLFPNYRVALGNPLLLEEVLARHPRLRVWVMHYGSPLIDEMIAVLQSYPQVYVDISPNHWRYPRAHFYRQLQSLIDAGFGKRVMYGSDQMNWPGVIEPAIAVVVASESMQHQSAAEIYRTVASLYQRLPPPLQQQAEDLVLRSLSGFGEHVLTSDLEGSLSGVADAVALAGRSKSFNAIRDARSQLGLSIGRLNSRPTRSEAIGEHIMPLKV